MVLQLTVKGEFVSRKTNSPMWLISDDYGNEAYIKKSYICDELHVGDRCLFKISAGSFENRGYLIFNFLHVVKRAES